MAKTKFYTLDRILQENADYNIIYGERSNGKTTAVLWYAIKDHWDSGGVNQVAIVRRWEEDYKGAKGTQMFEGITKLGWIEDLTSGAFNAVKYYSQRWYLCRYNDKGEKEAQEEEPFAIGFAITSEEHYKSTSYPNIRTVLFDEFITRSYYLPDEFIKFQNLLSTIIRLRTDVKIFMCGNTVNKFCPYFNEMGLSNVKKQKIGSIDLYTYGDSDLRVAVEYSDFPTKEKKSNKYFAFNNPKLKMITHGAWEIDIYPHLPTRYTPEQCILSFYILFDEELLQGNIICADKVVFLYIHRKTTPIKEDNDRLVYQQAIDYRNNYRTTLLRPRTKIEQKILELFKYEKVFYQDNEVGEIVNNYIKWCEVNK